ncbi:hypothetical protein [Candidatus Spongiihabitans sp.]|uniref:hypothetical protein n=1 Tax=Candidatus Spongiihabitans sp. TaxID=3101308 RepID=UPI003C7C44A9
MPRPEPASGSLSVVARAEHSRTGCPPPPPPPPPRTDQQQRALQRLPAYLCALHHKGVYCKALHLGQILVQADGSFALIDIHSSKFRARPISVNHRISHFFNTLRYAEDRASLTRYGLARFFGDYLQGCQLGEKHQAKLLSKLRNSSSFPELEQALGDL